MQEEKHYGTEDQKTVHGRSTPKNNRCDDLELPSYIVPCLQLLRQYLVRVVKFFRTMLEDLGKKIQRLNETVDRHERGFQQCVNIVKNCQEQTARILNYEFERHALEPAVETVAALADELLRLDHVARKLLQGNESNVELKTLANELQISGSIAEDKLSYLDIERIRPSRTEVIDPEKHSICDYADTENKALHGRISKLITPGILYRGKMLRQARVSIFRFTE